MDSHAEHNVSQFSMRLYATMLGWYLFGCCMGAVVMVWYYEQHQPKPQPVIKVEQDGAGAVKERGLPNSPEPVAHQQARDAAPPLAIERQFAQFKADQEARFTRQEQRNKEQAFALRKLQGVKQNWDVALQEVTR